MFLRLPVPLGQVEFLYGGVLPKVKIPFPAEKVPILNTFYWSVEVCVVMQLTPWTPDLEVWCSSLACHVVSLDKELYSTLSLFTQGRVVQSWVKITLG